MADENTDDATKAAAWTRETFDSAVNMIMDIGVVAGEMAEARAAWAVPYKAVIGQVREAKAETAFTWLICGDLPTDHVSSTVAATARDAARHFALKWQMNAARFEDPATRKALRLDEAIDWEAHCRALIVNAEELYAIAEDDSFWPETPAP